MSENNPILQLTVRNHAGVMSHICGLLARRSYNVEGIMCVPLPDGQLSQVWLLLDGNLRLDQVTKQILKLVDVLEIQCGPVEAETFSRLTSLFGE
jgi:acetolactate synthase-1/3 small subunit